MALVGFASQCFSKVAAAAVFWCFLIFSSLIEGLQLVNLLSVGLPLVSSLSSLLIKVLF
jgi:hypothetical protein